MFSSLDRPTSAIKSTSQPSRLLPMLGLASLLLAPAHAADSDGAFVDQLRTLELSQELDARAQLGGVAVDRLGFIYVANFRDALFRISPDDGTVTTLTRSLYGSSGLAIEPNGDILQSNFFGNTISRIKRTGEVEPFANGLNGPVGLAISPDGTTYVCNCTGNTISRINREGTVDSRVDREPFAESELFACPNGITFGGDGALYVTSFNSHDIARVDTEDGTVTRFATVPGGAGNAHLTFAKGFFYVTKIVAHQVVRVSADGKDVATIAGTGAPGHADGPALEGSFHRPNGIAASASGDTLYINEVVGDITKPGPTTVALRTLELMTLTKALDEHLGTGDLDAARDTYARFKADPVKGPENTVGEMVTYGYTFLNARKVAEALLVFELNAADLSEGPRRPLPSGRGQSLHRPHRPGDRALRRGPHPRSRAPEREGAHRALEQQVSPPSSCRRIVSLWQPR